MWVYQAVEKQQSLAGLLQKMLQMIKRVLQLIVFEPPVKMLNTVGWTKFRPVG
jgi:hypothetical protein